MATAAMAVAHLANIDAHVTSYKPYASEIGVPA
jgi:hypothetical protein